ncbi:hypothetical protein [Brevundimonas aurantiaca]|uniref:hypothetical protein n=1 Tax=Brevundimonas aurantiaca TaxID=74316 RepID=UPI001D196493|nr:hypothetical protein [Brevundimonas aurantiaca]MCC4295862.1 hypothetical protein [Brevundimonas aurantiaca]
MIFRIVEEATGRICMSIDCDPETARLYLQPGQVLMSGGANLMIDETKLVVVDGVSTRKPGASDDPRPLAGEGEMLAAVEA